MWPKLKQQIWQWRAVLITAPSVAGFVIVGGAAGLFQLLEWAALDQFFRLRPLEPPDSRIVLVTVDESDITQLGKWPVPDAVLAQAIETLKQHQPRAIGMDLYRNLPVEPGHQELVKVYRSTPNLIGVQKVVGDPVSPSPTLSRLGQVGIADIVLDADGKVRRGLISVRPESGKIELGLGARLALMYLEAEGITPKEIDVNKQIVKIGKSVFVPFTGNDGGYVRTDSGGYQILLNFRGPKESFQSISITDVLENRIPPNLLRDRIVLIGSIARSLNDFFYTPYSNSLIASPQPTPGVVIQANLASQILSAALEGRPSIRVWPDVLEWLWILGWSFIGAASSRALLQASLWRRKASCGWTVPNILLLGVSLVSSSYLAFLGGWWIPIVGPLLALTGAAIAIAGYHNRELQRLASLDSLTLLANRRYFDEHLEREWQRSMRENKPLSLILCDVDCFKLYNDTYGHQAGDECLQKVSTAIRTAVRRNDLVARYGGEEFAVILPDTNSEIAVQVARRICIDVKALRIDHVNSNVSPYVTLSCGVTSTVSELKFSAADLAIGADKWLYDAKKRGRDRVSLG